MQTQLTRAEQFRSLHQQGPLLLPNAWDIASARIFEQAGFPALGTTSAGIAYSRGLGDAQRIERDEMLAQIAAIARAVAVPLTADIEAGYGASPEAVAETVRLAIQAGAVGVNLEDNSHGLQASPLFDCTQQSLRIAAARTAALEAGLPLWINARTDVYLLGLGEDAEARFAMCVDRANQYLAAGADMAFVPGVIELDLVARLSAAIHGPLNLMALPGAPSAQELFAAGARRVSLGLCPMLATMGVVREIATEAKSHGTWQTMQRSFFAFAEAEALFAKN